MLAGLADVSERRAEHLRILRHGLERIIVELVLSLRSVPAFASSSRASGAHTRSPHASTGPVPFHDERTVMTTPNQRKASGHAQPTMRPE